MTTDTPNIPAPPPGWAIVPADDARLDCLPVRPMVYNHDDYTPKWKESIYRPSDEIGTIDRRYAVYALPASQPEQASPAEDEVVTWAQQAAAENRQVCNNLSAAERQSLLERAEAIIGGTDPKGEAGKAKAPLALLPPEALRQAAWAHGLGAEKYGVANWRENQVCATTYVSAMMRHIGQYLDGEDADAESGLSHLAHVIASANILIDAKHCGTLVDDRPKRPA
jgi:hypothetical protein